MNDYQAVDQALAGGADPAMLCATCPWDRYCITPPTMTRAEVEQHMEQAKIEDAARRATAAEGDHSLPVGMLMTAMVMGGWDKTAGVCPVFALRLRSSAGRGIVDGLKAQMQAWDDNNHGVER